MIPKPSDFAKPRSGSVRKLLDLPTLKVSSKAAPTRKDNGRDDVAYGVDSLEKLVDAFDERERALKNLKSR